MIDDEMNNFIETLIYILNDPVFMHIHQTSSEQIPEDRHISLVISVADMNSALDEKKQSMKTFLETLKKETIVDLDTQTLTTVLKQLGIA
ncbi:hypothetical protein DPMN_160353 [Dreissena polymorpha]|uniref:Uncharacterized protein n=1 Tax=Dreissena polymorpha TaxID=45954 RepID=A0A9D4EMM7_DREPO|nr:hypothetical protein DPMN_160353 [Dreissena polymorpha]